MFGDQLIHVAQNCAAVLGQRHGRSKKEWAILWGDRPGACASYGHLQKTHQRPAEPGWGNAMRRIAALIMLTLLGACSTVADLSPLSPSASSSPTVAVRAPRFELSLIHI